MSKETVATTDYQEPDALTRKPDLSHVRFHEPKDLAMHVWCSSDLDTDTTSK